MLGRGGQLGMLVPESQSPSRVLGVWPATWGNCVAEPQTYPSQWPWTIRQASQRLPPKIIAQIDPRTLSTDCLGAGRGKAKQVLLTVWEPGEGLPRM